MTWIWLDAAGWLRWVVLAGGVVSLATIRTRLAPWTAALALILLLVGLEAARFDGRPHIGEKMDGTFFAWMWQLSVRIHVGVAALLSAAPIGIAAARIANVRPRALWGVAVIAPVGAALVISGLRLSAAADRLLRMLGEPRSRFELLVDAVRDSERILLAGVAIGAAAATVICVRLLRAPLPTDPAARP